MFGLGVLPTIVLIVVVFLIFRGIAHWMYGEDDTDMHTFYKKQQSALEVHAAQQKRELSDYRRMIEEMEDPESNWSLEKDFKQIERRKRDHWNT